MLHVQDDLLYETLTVYETLYFAAMLRLPSAMSTEQKTQRVDHVIRTLGLDKCKDTIVGEGARMTVHSRVPFTEFHISMPFQTVDMTGLLI